MNVSIFGAGGYIGSALVPYLCERGHQVTAIDTFPNPAAIRGACAYPNLTIAKGDCRDIGFLAHNLVKADIIYWLVGMTGDRPYETMAEINVELPRTLARIVSKEQQVVYLNTNAGYVPDADKIVTERTPMLGRTNYSKTKIEGEKILLDVGNCVSFRLAAVYGPAPVIRWETLLNHIIFAAVRGDRFALFEPNVIRDVIFISDLVERLSLPTFAGPVYGFFNLSGDSMIKESFVKAVQAQLPKFEYRALSDGPRDPEGRDYKVSTALIDSLDHVSFKCTSLAKGIATTIQAARLEAI